MSKNIRNQSGITVLAGGPAGATGPRGTDGSPGGATGARGPKGDTGDNGENGSDGATGEKGDTGAVGIAGPKGDTGTIGLTGDIGPTGTGSTGPPGIAGPKGDTGTIGLTGNIGPTGGLGARGATGVQGVVGSIGPTGAQGSAANAWNLTGNAGTTPGTNYMGASNNQSVIIATNGGTNPNRLQISNNGRIEPTNTYASTYFGNLAGGLGGSENSFFGNGAGNVCNASFSSGFGFSALGSLISGGGWSCAFGHNAGANVTTGNTNNLFGFQSGLGLITGGGNTFFGNNSGRSVGSACNNAIILGTSVGDPTDNNLIRIGNGQVKNFTAGIRGITPDNNDAIPVYISSTGQLCTVSSFWSPTTLSLSVLLSGPFTPTSATFKFTRVGRVVYVEIPFLSIQVTTANSAIATPANVIPLAYRPVTSGFPFITLVRSGASSTDLVQGLIAFTSDNFVVRVGISSPFGAVGSWCGLAPAIISYLTS